MPKSSEYVGRFFQTNCVLKVCFNIADGKVYK